MAEAFALIDCLMVRCLMRNMMRNLYRGRFLGHLSSATHKDKAETGRAAKISRMMAAVRPVRFVDGLPLTITPFLIATSPCHDTIMSSRRSASNRGGNRLVLAQEVLQTFETARLHVKTLPSTSIEVGLLCGTVRSLFSPTNDTTRELAGTRKLTKNRV